MRRLKITPEQFKKIRSLNESLAGIVKDGIVGVASTKVPTQEAPAPATPPKHADENIVSPELLKAINELIENIWLNPTQKRLDGFFAEHHISWGDIISYLVTKGIVKGLDDGSYKVVNFFKSKFSPDENQAIREKKEEIKKIAAKIVKDPKAPWGQQLATAGAPEVDENYYTVEPHPDSPDANRKDMSPKIQRNTHKQAFTPVAMGGEACILQGPDGKYVFFFDMLTRDDFPNPEYDLTPEDVADYVNDNLDTISKGVGIRDFEQASLVKLDEPLKAELMSLYAKDSNLMKGLQNLEETTGAASSGAFVAPLGTKPIKREIYQEEATKTQYPGGEMVTFDKCVSYNNNKDAENGKCSQGAVDNVVKTHKTKGAVVAKEIYDKIAAKTGRNVEEIQELIESKLAKNKSL